MATVLRLKRRSDVSPLEALMVASKKRKTEDSDAEASASSLETKVISPLTTIANFAGTIDSQVLLFKYIYFFQNYFIFEFTFYYIFFLAGKWQCKTPDQVIHKGQVEEQFQVARGWCFVETSWQNEARFLGESLQSYKLLESPRFAKFERSWRKSHRHWHWGSSRDRG